MIRTAECVSPKHPDKLCDQVSDAILDECLTQDPMSRVAIETMGGHGILTITGELTTKAYVDIPKIARSIVGENIGVQVNVVSQSPEISRGVDTGGAGDQGIMVGYACNENPEMIPDELYLARRLCRKLYGEFPADGKTQVTLDNGKITTVVASWCGIHKEPVEQFVREWLDCQDRKYIKGKVEIHANPAGDWDIGGFDADTGLTGRKIAVDNYGPRIPIGGGAFSGKDATKVDRSGAYMARKAATTWLKLKNKHEVYVYVAYAIGKAEPIQCTIIEKDERGRHTEYILNGVDLKDQGIDFTYNAFSPKEMIDILKLREPKFRQTAEWGHMGNGFTWDK